jgi:hypothetical protein
MSMAFTKLIGPKLFQAGVIQRGIVAAQTKGTAGYDTDSRGDHPGNTMSAASIYQQEFYETRVTLKNPTSNTLVNSELVLKHSMKALGDEYKHIVENIDSSFAAKAPGDLRSLQFTITGHAMSFFYDPITKEGILIDQNFAPNWAFLRDGVSSEERSKQGHKELGVYYVEPESGPIADSPVIQVLKSFYGKNTELGKIPRAGEFLHNVHGLGKKQSDVTVTLVGAIDVVETKTEGVPPKLSDFTPSYLNPFAMGHLNREHPESPIEHTQYANSGYKENSIQVGVDRFGMKPVEKVKTPPPPKPMLFGFFPVSMPPPTEAESKAMTFKQTLEKHAEVLEDYGYANLVDGKFAKIMRDKYVKWLATKKRGSVYRDAGQIKGFGKNPVTQKEACEFAKKAGLFVPVCQAVDPYPARARAGQ